MLTKEQAAQLLGLNTVKSVKPFKQDDFYNSPNIIEGFICFKSSYQYGSLVICRVNSQDVQPQVIWGTPKLGYPFGYSEQKDERIYNWPELGESGKYGIYEKRDGTNVGAYSYSDVDGERYITFKTRLMPVTRKSDEFGDFLGLWKEILAKHPEILEYPGLLSGDLAYSFEMYGYRCPHMIQYEEALEATLLFTVNQRDHSILPPDPTLSLSNKIIQQAQISDKDNLTQIYNLRRQLDEESLVQVGESDEGEPLFTGTEGKVFYILDKDRKIHMYKAKPPQVEEVHMNRGSIHLASIKTTLVNALENKNINDITYEYILELLSEEYPAKRLENNEERIKKALRLFKDQINLINRVKRVVESTDITLPTYNKGLLLKAISVSFVPKQMSSVYQACIKLGFIKND